MLTLILALLAVTSCSGDVVEQLVGGGKASTLVQLVTKVGLAPTLKSGTYTVFAPTDAAFAKLSDATLTSLLTNNTALTEVLKEHVVAGTLLSKDITDEMKVTTLDGDKIRLNIYPQKNVVTANGAVISQPDVTASNGVIHYVDDVIPPADKTVVQLVAEDPDLSTLLTAITAAGIAFEFQADNLTLFAPTNAAFAAVPADDLALLLSNPTYLKEALEYHAVERTLYSAGLYSHEIETSMDSKDDRLFLTVSGTGVDVNQARVQQTDIVAKNGVVHKIDRVLLPRSVLQWIYSQDNNPVGK